MWGQLMLGRPVGWQTLDGSIAVDCVGHSQYELQISLWTWPRNIIGYNLNCLEIGVVPIGSACIVTYIYEFALFFTGKKLPYWHQTPRVNHPTLPLGPRVRSSWWLQAPPEICNCLSSVMPIHIPETSTSHWHMWRKKRNPNMSGSYLIWESKIITQKTTKSSRALGIQSPSWEWFHGT